MDDDQLATDLMQSLRRDTMEMLQEIAVRHIISMVEQDIAKAMRESLILAPGLQSGAE